MAESGSDTSTILVQYCYLLNSLHTLPNYSCIKKNKNIKNFCAEKSCEDGIAGETQKTEKCSNVHMVKLKL